jgi:hypothetical protein
MPGVVVAFELPLASRRFPNSQRGVAWFETCIRSRSWYREHYQHRRDNKAGMRDRNNRLIFILVRESLQGYVYTFEKGWCFLFSQWIIPARFAPLDKPPGPYLCFVEALPLC